MARCGPISTGSDERYDRGQALIEAAIVLPVLLMLIVGGLILGLATVDDIRLERATADAARLSEPEARQVVRAVDGRVVCYWQGVGEGECFDDGLVIERTQVASVGRRWVYPTGSVTPSAQVSRPTEGETP